MNSASGEEDDPGSPGLALFLLLAGGLTAFFGLRIADSAFLNPHDPGPRLLPVSMALVLCLGGAYEIGRWWRRRASSLVDRRRYWEDYRRLLVLQVLLLAYVCLIPVSGFAAASVLATVALLMWFGLSWWKAVAVAVILVVVIQLLFVTAMKVQLPMGIFFND